ncbi:YfaZ family outer membrane protein [Thiomicrospira microaerophila]|uniref:YfaZ family outer membrane protein n=1 Tax=Thiomicrospira microaerophila TaxID=406020 RepID=UPI0006973D09|nr:YfaZ family outer membrane protein [Thiomicrospira microaerophila]
MKKLVQVCTFGLAGLFSGYAIAERPGFGLQLADETAKLSLFTETEWVRDIYRLDAGFQFDDDKNYALDASVLYKGKGLLDPNTDIGIKAKLAYLTMDSGIDALGVLLGIQASYWMPTTIPTAITAGYLYSPKVLTTGDGDSLVELDLRYSARLMRSMTGYVGYRQLKIKMENVSDIHFDKGVHIGIELSF